MTTEKGVFDYAINGVNFSLREKIDVSLLNDLGRVFIAFDQNDSGNISFGVQRGDKRFFCKIAGLATLNSITTKEQAIEALKNSVEIHNMIKHPLLIGLHSFYQRGKVFIAEYPWCDGECLFDHWNFSMYDDNDKISPLFRFKNLSQTKKTGFFYEIASFMKDVNDKGYVAIDLYDSSLLFDFRNEKMHVCDIDFFEKLPYYNNGFVWGSDRFKAPEEYILGSALDQRTDVYHLAIFATVFFGKHHKECTLADWELSEHQYMVVKKALSIHPDDRYGNIELFINDFYS